MGILSEKSEQVAQQASELLYEVGQGKAHRLLHQQGLALLVSVNELQQLAIDLEEKGKKPQLSPEEAQEKEIAKVTRKLKRWAKNPEQINTRLLLHFLAHYRAGTTPITKSMLEQFADREGIKNFNSNLFGMSHIWGKNHGKLFDVEDGVITIWPPVADQVATFSVKEGDQNQVETAAPVEVTTPAATTTPIPPSAPISETASQDQGAIEAIYIGFKQLWLKRSDHATVMTQLEQLGIDSALAANQLEALEQMMRGEAYQTPMSASAIRYLLHQFGQDFSRGYLDRVVRAIRAHLEPKFLSWTS